AMRIGIVRRDDCLPSYESSVPRTGTSGTPVALNSTGCCNSGIPMWVSGRAEGVKHCRTALSADVKGGFVMRRKLQTILGVSALAAAMQVGAQVTVYPNNAPVTVYPNAPSTSADVAAADRVFEARVISSRPVSGPSQQQCHMERQQVGPLELPGVLL